MKKEKKKKSLLGRIIFITLVVICLACIGYKPFVEKFVIPHTHNSIAKDTRQTPAYKYAENNRKITDELNLQGWSDKAAKKFNYNDKPENNTVTGIGDDLSGTNNNNNNNYTQSGYGKNAPDLTYNYGNVRPVSEYDWSTLRPNYDKRLLTGHIAIPAIGIDLPILEGVSNANLYAGAGTLKPYQQMGKNNYALASHYMPDGYSNFTQLHKLVKGNRILLTNGHRVYEYSTVSVKQVPINSSNVVNDEHGKTEVTLVTCTDIYGTSRLVVKGNYIQSHSMNSSYGKYFK